MNKNSTRVQFESNSSLYCGLDFDIWARAESAAQKEDSQSRAKMSVEEYELAVQAYYQAFVRDMEKYTFGI